MQPGSALDDMSIEMADLAMQGERLLLNGRVRLKRSVRDQPGVALLIACTIGYLVGWMASRI